MIQSHWLVFTFSCSFSSIPFHKFVHPYYLWLAFARINVFIIVGNFRQNVGGVLGLVRFFLHVNFSLEFMPLDVKFKFTLNPKVSVTNIASENSQSEVTVTYSCQVATFFNLKIKFKFVLCHSIYMF